MTGAAEFFEELRREYLTEAPARMAELRKDLAAARAGEASAVASLKMRFHRLAGSGGSYGFPDISTVARSAEAWIVANPTPDPTSLGALEDAIGKIAGAFDAAGASVGLPASTDRPATTFGWRALVLTSAGGAADTIEATLTDAQFAVQRRPLGHRPDDLATSERPDVVVIVGEESPGLSQIVANWALPGKARPMAVVLIAQPDTANPLAQPFASLDATLPSEGADQEVLVFVRRLARTATAPRAVLVLDPSGTGSSLVSALEGERARVRSVATADELAKALDVEGWDAIVADWRLPDTTAIALVRWIRRRPGNQLTPIMILADKIGDDDHLAAIRAGADDVLLRGSSVAYLNQSIQARIDRCRSVRAVAHRDDLTGLLNLEALTDELGRSIGLARRANETVCLIVIDIDHFRRINEEFGHLGGDIVLTEVARILGGTVRSSDLVARTGGEEFAALIRRCRADDAARVGEKIRQAVAEAAISTAGSNLRVNVSIGIACYPDHGLSAEDLLREAERALGKAKSAGRDRVVVADAPA